MRYIELKNKKPISKLEDYMSLNEVKHKDSYGRILEDNELFVDIDSEKESEKLLEIIKAENIGTRVYKTSRGMHFSFNNPYNVKNVIHSNTPIGISVDIKTGKNNSYQVLKLDGKERELIYEKLPIDDIPKWLLPFNHKTNYLDLRDGDGRNDELFRSIIPMTKMNMNKEEIETTLKLVNKYMFAEQLDENEIYAMVDNNQFMEDRKLTFYVGKKLQHNLVSDYIIEAYNCRYYNGSIYFYTDRGYSNNMKELELIIYNLIPEITTNSIKEILHYIDIHLAINPTTPTRHYIQTLNGLVNLYTGEFREFDKNIFTTVSIPVYFNTHADEKEMTDALMMYANYDKELFELLVEFIAYIFFDKNKFRKMFMLYGIGSNGKSKYTSIIEKFIGKENITSLSLDDLNHRFKVAALVSSRCNIGNDIGAKLLDDSQMIKKLTGEDLINADRKNRDPIEFECSAKLVFSCNKLPRANDKSYGFYNRFIILPFTFDFDSYKGSDDFNIIDFCNINNMSALLNMIIPRYKRLIDNNRFSRSQKVIENLIMYMSSNDGVAKWYFANNIKDKEYENITDAYNEYLLYCSLNRFNSVNSITFMENYNNVVKIYKNLIKD